MKTFLQLSLAACAGLAFVFAGIGFTPSAHAQWGNVKMTFKVSGKAPEMAKLKPTKDPAVCANPKNSPLVDESFVVGKSGGVQNIIVYLVPEKGAKLKIHDSYAADEKSKIELDNKHCQFVPHVLAVRTGQTLVLKNSDPVGHNTKLDFTSNAPQNPILPPMSDLPLKAADLAKAEKRATPVSCSIHPWMTAYVLVQDHPYMGVSNEDGEVEIKNLPVGKHTFQVWQEQVGYVNPEKSKHKFAKGKVEIEVKEGANDLGELMVKPK